MKAMNGQVGQLRTGGVNGALKAVAQRRRETAGRLDAQAAGRAREQRRRTAQGGPRQPLIADDPAAWMDDILKGVAAFGSTWR